MVDQFCVYNNVSPRRSGRDHFQWGPDWVRNAVNPTRTKRDQTEWVGIDFTEISPVQLFFGSKGSGVRISPLRPNKINNLANIPHTTFELGGQLEPDFARRKRSKQTPPPINSCED